jgi:phosphomannomutase
MIFKAYDIRGIYPDEITEEIAYKIGRAFVIYIGEGSNIVLSRDGRKSSESLFDSLKKGVIDQGGNVIDIGLSTSPMLYFATEYLNCDGGIIVTASHNPSEYNGFKMVRKHAFPLSGESGIGEIKNMVLNNKFVSPEKKGKITVKDISKKYIESFQKENYKNLKIVVDTANSVSGLIVPEMLRGVNLIHIFQELDGNFPNHEPNPLKEENLKMLQKKVTDEEADLGIAFDGDGDRVFFVDEKGKMIPSDLILALVSSLILEKESSKILYDIRCSNIVRETIEKLSGTAFLSRVGHSFIKSLMKEEEILFGGEYSGHYYLKQGESYFESPYFVIFKILEALEDKKMSELILPFKKYYHSGEINFEVKDKDSAIKLVEKKYTEGKINRIDGLRVDFEDWWFLLRASNTEPVLRLNVEAQDEDILNEKVKEIKETIAPFFF